MSKSLTEHQKRKIAILIGLSSALMALYHHLDDQAASASIESPLFDRWLTKGAHWVMEKKLRKRIHEGQSALSNSGCPSAEAVIRYTGWVLHYCYNRNNPKSSATASQNMQRDHENLLRLEAGEDGEKLKCSLPFVNFMKDSQVQKSSTVRRWTSRHTFIAVTACLTIAAIAVIIATGGIGAIPVLGAVGLTGAWFLASVSSFAIAVLLGGGACIVHDKLSSSSQNVHP